MCPNGGEYRDGLCHRDGSVVPLDGMTWDDAGVETTEDSGIDSGPACEERTFHRDADGDGFGDRASSIRSCDAPEGYVEDDRDCDDDCEACGPEGTEVCDADLKDEDCDGASNEADAGCTCIPGSAPVQCGTTDVGECSYGTQRCVDGTYGECEGVVSPVDEICNGVDDDCDERVDESVTTTFYRDADGDTYGNAAMTMQACAAPSGYVARAMDCNDSCSACHPGRAETCDGENNDCDTATDEGVLQTFYRDLDGDTFGSATSPMTACAAPAGYVANDDDCNDSCGSCRPGGTEVCDGLDNDCAGGVDNGVRTTFYADCDGDTFAASGAVTTSACEPPSAAPAACGAGGSWTDRAPTTGQTDCADSNSSAFPGQTQYFGSPIAGAPASRDFDYDCDNVETRRYTLTNVTACGGGTESQCRSRSGWSGSTTPACGAEAQHLECLPPISGSSCAGLGPRAVAQRCR
ncbi:BNR repeat domain protein [Sandaracinus amylolyticus]|uniref:BNR repeat domain protein n=1 Tax=Sandaracinus amylolyticus TaxID=927083 RepID=A0A0F6W560_9BACT|nr:BNR repeat domain protein [Sandaracinus amylolyticus]